MHNQYRPLVIDVQLCCCYKRCFLKNQSYELVCKEKVQLFIPFLYASTALDVNNRAEMTKYLKIIAFDSRSLSQRSAQIQAETLFLYDHPPLLIQSVYR